VIEVAAESESDRGGIAADAVAAMIDRRALGDDA
jgi:hypothetical protein